MFKPLTYITLAASLITLEIYRIPLPFIGLNVSSYQFFFVMSFYIGVIILLMSRVKIEIDDDSRLLTIMLLLFVAYSFVSFFRNYGEIRPESRAMFLSEVFGYAMVFTISLLIARLSEIKTVTKAFLASLAFVVLGTYWHVYNYVAYDKVISGIPFWTDFSKSEQVNEYIDNFTRFSGFPRFRLPFASPAAAGIFLGLAGVLLLALTLPRARARNWMTYGLIALNLVTIYCLLGTFSRACWALYVVGSLCVIWYSMKTGLIRLGRLTIVLIIAASLFFFVVSWTSYGTELFHMVGLRVDLQITEASDAGHIESRELALKYWQENPVFGLGIGGYWLKPGTGIHTHSTYFTYLVERGIVGLGLFLGFFYLMMRMMRRRIQDLTEREERGALTYAIGFMGCLVGLFVGFFLYEMDSDVVWLLFAIIIVFLRVTASRKTKDFQLREDLQPVTGLNAAGAENG